MFQIGFGECVLVLIVAVFVLGPDRLPAVARVGGRYLQQLKNLILTVKQELEAETEQQSKPHDPKDNP